MQRPVRRLARALARRVDEPVESRISEVLPEWTDPELKNWLEPHLVAVPTRPSALARLWVFLPGSFGLPQRHTALFRFIASCGDWAINLRYPNEWTIKGLSLGHPDPHIHELLRLQILDGKARTDLLPLPPNEGVIHRLEKLVAWLDQQNPDAGWSSFRSESGQLLWSRIGVAGHSQGGGHAALLGKIHVLHRVVMLSSPSDWLEHEHCPAPWIEQPGLTPTSRYFGFAHALEPSIKRVVAAWQHLGLERFGPVANADGDGDFGGSHCFTTEAPVAEDRYHASLANDRFAPKTGRRRHAHERVWRYLLGHKEVA